MFSLFGIVSRYGSLTNVFSVRYCFKIWFIDKCFSVRISKYMYMVHGHVFSQLGMVPRYSSWTRVFSVGYDIKIWFKDTCFLCLGMISTHGL